METTLDFNFILLMMIFIVAIIAFFTFIMVSGSSRNRDALIKIINERTALIDSLTEQNKEIKETSKSNNEQLIKLQSNDEHQSTKLDSTRKEIFESSQKLNEDVTNKLFEITKSFDAIKNVNENVVGLNDLLQNRQVRGAFAEVQLEQLVRSILAEKLFSFQYTLSNNSRVDCALFLEHENNKVMCIDSKFPLDAYHRYSKGEESLATFKRDVKKHIKDISSKYIIHQETNEWAMMFVPSELIFSTIHSEMMDVVQFSFEEKVAIVSPNTMMATLATLQAAIRDYTLNKDAIKVRNAMVDLFQEFKRYEERYVKLKSAFKRTLDGLDELTITHEKLMKKLAKIESFNIEED